MTTGISMSHTLPAWERQYLSLLERVLYHGEPSDDRTGTGTRRLFAPEPLRIPTDTPPAPLTKRLFDRGVMVELCWMMRGLSNIAYLKQHRVNIWDEWADERGELGPVYGVQWRRCMAWDGQGDDICVDQLQQLIDGIRTNPASRRHLMTTWNPTQLDDMRLPPCHGIVLQCFVSGDGTLHALMHQRSADLFLGLPFNILSYATLLRLLAHWTGLRSGQLTITLGDAHIYSNHTNAVRTQLDRARSVDYSSRPLPAWPTLREGSTPDDVEPGELRLVGYRPDATIKAPISI